jgi:hypothetical protein
MKNKKEVLGKPALTTTEICKRLGVNVSVDFIETKLGIKADEKTPTSSLWMESKFEIICLRLGQYFFKLNEKRNSVGGTTILNFGTPNRGESSVQFFRGCSNTTFEHSRSLEMSFDNSLMNVFFGGFKMGVETEKERSLAEVAV